MTATQTLEGQIGGEIIGAFVDKEFNLYLAVQLWLAELQKFGFALMLARTLLKVHVFLKVETCPNFHAQNLIFNCFSWKVKWEGFAFPLTLLQGDWNSGIELQLGIRSFSFWIFLKSGGKCVEKILFLLEHVTAPEFDPVLHLIYLFLLLLFEFWRKISSLTYFFFIKNSRWIIEMHDLFKS